MKGTQNNSQRNKTT